MKSRIFWLAVLVAVVGLALGGSAPGQAGAQEQVTVEGRVVNGTEGGTVAPGLPVFLHIFSQGASPVTSLEAATDEQGGFRFEAVTSAAEAGHAITMDYGGMRYSKLLGPEDLDGPVELLVYETTQDLSVIRVQHQALVITGVDQREQLVEAVEFVSLVNQSDRTLLPDLSNVGQGEFSFLRFSLPPGATDFDIESDLVGGEVIPVGTGFGLTTPVVPGEHNLNFSFKFPYQGSTFSYRQNLLQGADLYQLLVPERLGSIQVSRLEAMPPLDVEGSAYRVWEGRGFAPGAGPVVELTNLPQPGLLARTGKTLTTPGFWHITIPITLGGALALVLLYAAFRSPRATPAPAAEPGRANGHSAHREALVRAVAALDEKYQQGQLPEADYRVQRAQLKERVIQASSQENTG